MWHHRTWVRVTLHCCDNGIQETLYTIHYRQAMPHNSISPALFVSTAVSLGYVTVWTWHDRTGIQVNHRSCHGTPGHTTATPHIYTHNTKKSYSLTRQDYQLTINSLKVAFQLQSVDMEVNTVAIILVVSVNLWDRIQQLSHSTQCTHWSKAYHIMTSYIIMYTLIKN